MFKALPQGTTIRLHPRSLVTVHSSINTPAIAYGGGPMLPARATVAVFLVPGNLYTVYVYIGPDNDGSGPSSGGLLFLSDPQEIDLHNYEVLVDEALEMCEAQGFSMERVELEGEDDPRRDAHRRRLPFESNAARVPASQRQTVVQAPVSLPPPVQDTYATTQPPRDVAEHALGTGAYAAPVEISREISLPEAVAIRALGRVLSLF